MKTKSKISKLEQILNQAEKKGATSCEVIQKSSTESPVSFENNQLKTLESNESSGIAVRLIKDNKIGIASSTDPDALEALVTSAIEASEFGSNATFEFTEKELKLPASGLSLQSIPLEELIDRGTKAVEKLKIFHKDLMVSGGFDHGVSETVYLNSKGVSGKKEKSIFSTVFHALLVQEGDFLGIYDAKADSTNFPSEAEIIGKVLSKLNYSKQLVSLETKKYSVIFTPRAVASIFSEILASMLDGKAIQQSISPLIDKLGKKLFDEKLSFIEDPTVGISRESFDDEGIKTQRKDLIKNGTVDSFYFDLSTASKIGNKNISTGNGFKPSLGSAPAPDLTSLVVNPGKTSYQDLLGNVKEGVLVDQVLGAGQSNVLAGEFSVGIDLGFKIQNGEIKGRIKNCMIAGNVFEVLNKITELSKEQELVGGAMLLPHMLIDDMVVAGK